MPAHCDGWLEFVGGSLFEEIPEGDATILMEVLHDWSDEECVRILKTIRRSAAPGSRLLIVEADVGEGDDRTSGKLLDVIMITLFAGRQRTRAEFEALFSAANFRLVDATSAKGGSKIFAGEPV